MTKIPFTTPTLTEKELDNIDEAIQSCRLAGDGRFSRLCESYLENHFHAAKVFLTPSCTAALELAALTLNIQSGDEVIMPSYTFASTANAFALRGAVPVFVDIRSDTLNIDEELIQHAVTKKTKAIVPVHYAGVSANMERITETADSLGLKVIEDAAQAMGSKVRGHNVGRSGCLATLSFHETKNIVSGEGGALIVNDPQLVNRADVIRNKGTNRKEFFEGIVDKYTWVELGSSFLVSELVAAFLLPQLEAHEKINNVRLQDWNSYHENLSNLETTGHLRRPIVPRDTEHNGHLYYILVDSREVRDRLIAYLSSHGISSVFHYTPLHSSPAGCKYGRSCGDLSVTDTLSSQLLRLPINIGQEQVNRICDQVSTFFLRE